jgi:hypothetical protein
VLMVAKGNRQLHEGSKKFCPEGHLSDRVGNILSVKAFPPGTIHFNDSY